MNGHLATFSMKQTPLPFLVLANTRLGLPGRKGTASSVVQQLSDVIAVAAAYRKAKCLKLLIDGDN